MDFISNIIKRPMSIVLPDPSPSSSSSTTAISTGMQNQKEKSPSPGPNSPLIARAMNRSINTELTDLLDSAALDLVRLDQQQSTHSVHKENPNNSYTDQKPVDPMTPINNRETIQQLLNEINFNLNQVSINEMEHLQAMSEELSPLAMKSPNHVKPLAAVRPSLPGTPTTPTTTDPASGEASSTLEHYKLNADANGGLSKGAEITGFKFTGLPEFDETKIPELAPLIVDMEAQLKGNHSGISPALPLSSTMKLLEQDYNSDSDVYVECMSLNSEKFSADPSELETYRSALNEQLERQLTGGSREPTLGEATIAASHNCSYEPMDVDDINDTMEMIKGVLEPEDHQFLQQQVLSEAQHTSEEFNPEEQILEKPAEVSQERQNTEQEAAIGEKTETQLQQEQVLATSTECVEQKRYEEERIQPKEESKSVEPAASTSQPIPSLQAATSASLEPLSPPVPTLQRQQSPELAPTPSIEVLPSSIVEIPVPAQTSESPDPPLKAVGPPSVSTAAVSPPIPTHRPKTVSELELMAWKDTPLPPSPTQDDDSDRARSPSPAPCKSPLTLDMTRSIGSSGRASAPASPTFPLKTAESHTTADHFPRSPNAPPEQEQMSYLEKAIVQPSIERKLSTPIFPKSPVSIQITQPSPGKDEQLNDTMPMSFTSSQGGSPAPSVLLNGTFDGEPGARAEFVGGVILHADASSLERHTSPVEGVLISAAKNSEQRTFNTNASEEQSRRTFSLSEEQNHSRRTFNLTTDSTENVPLHPDTKQEGQEQCRRTFNLSGEEDHARRTFSLPTASDELEQMASPAFEATEETVGNEDFEPMDVDVSFRAQITAPTTSVSPPIPTHQAKKGLTMSEYPETQAVSPPLPTHQRKEPQLSPPLPTLLKRPTIEVVQNSPTGANVTVVLDEQMLSAKEQATLSASDEKDDVFVEHFGALSPVTDDIFKAPQYTSSTFASMTAAAAKAANNEGSAQEEQFLDGASNSNLIFNSSDLEYLYTKGSHNGPVDRSSLLLKFDPLLGTPVPANPQLNLLGFNYNNNNNLRALSPTIEEHESSGSNQSFVIEQPEYSAKKAKDFEFKPPVDRTKKHAKMSVEVIGNDCNKTFDNPNLNTEDKANNYHNMDELEKKIKNEVTKSEDIEKKLKEAEQREEALIKRITEKDKTNAKLNGVIEAYEKAIAELINEKEKLVQTYERQLMEVQTDRDSNYHHLTSLETTFSDLHVKYEKSKEMTSQLKQIEENLLTEKKQTMENLRLQEQRYEKMKSHAMQQLEIANKKLDTITKEHADEVKKLKALLKKEEVSRVSIAEQLQQKSRENADLVKICEELIYGKGQDF
ncbi:uncharacterized protein LOC115624193 isoform X2 [Scaptodrosophila lebanonensis]|uniref:Uncharacterized protein LOC115624193 isoform X2 n=1 Tax=Drosophila lebanonensis TaxID=7225 RepID=A0A6J2TCY0_DROLE|nr:uncharacterized protein LOC115624193 isoform X2 [Scaptodrosophila lebanonensis]